MLPASPLREFEFEESPRTFTIDFSRTIVGVLRINGLQSP
jgi:hypothetical protein